MAYFKKLREQRFNRLIRLIDDEGNEKWYRFPALCAVLFGGVFYALFIIGLVYYYLRGGGGGGAQPVSPNG